MTCAKISKVINNSAGDCSISLKFHTDFDHVTLDVPRTFKINESKVKVIAWHNVSASKNAIMYARITCRKSNLVKINNQEPSATRNAPLKVIRSNTEIAITPPRMARLRSNLVHHFTRDTLQMFKIKGQGHSVTCQWSS